MKDKIYYKLGFNIKGLRKSYGESQLALALEVGTSDRAISNYENGERIPERDTLLKIAKHYRVTEHELLYGDFANLSQLDNVQLFDIERNKKSMERFIPVITSEEAMKNEHFKKAYELHKLAFESTFSDAKCSNDDIENCMDLYDQAIEEGVIEAAANKTSMLMLFGIFFGLASSQIMTVIEKIDKKNISTKEFLEKGILASLEEPTEEEQEWQAARKDFIDDNEVDIMVNIYRLKHSEKYAELGDYYLALRYFFGITSTSVSDEMARAFGQELMFNLKVLGNPYAKKFYNE